MIPSKKKEKKSCRKKTIFITKRNNFKIKSHEKVCKNKYLCGIAIPSEKKNISYFNQYMKLDKMSHIIYADMVSLIKKADQCANNLENSSTTKTGENIPCRTSKCNLRFNVSSEIPVLFHYGSSYDYRFIIKELANEFGE